MRIDAPRPTCTRRSNWPTWSRPQAGCGPGFAALTYAAVIGLLASCGLRISEACGLDGDDVDLDEGVLTVRGSKFGKSRIVPVHATTLGALRIYDGRRDLLCPDPASAAFFLNSRGRRLDAHNVSHTFADDTPHGRDHRRGGGTSAQDSRPAALGGRWGYAACRVVVPGEGRVGRLFVRIIPAAGVTGPASRASRSGRCPRSSRAGRLG